MSAGKEKIHWSAIFPLNFKHLSYTFQELRSIQKYTLRTDEQGQTDERTDISEAICPSNFEDLGSILISIVIKF